MTDPTSDSPIQELADGAGCRILLYATPRASRTQLMGLHDGRLKLQVAAPPVDGAANEAIIKFLASQLGVSRACVQLSAGATGKRKTIEVMGVDAGAARLVLEVT